MRSVSFVRLVAVAAVAAGAVAVVPSPAAATTATAPHAPRHGLHRPMPAAGVPDAPTSATDTIEVVLPLAAPPGAARVLAAVKTARLSRTERRARLVAALPSPAQGAAVRAWARSHGFAVAGSTPLGVTLRGRADRLAAAFGTSVAATRLHGKTFATPRSAPRVPSALRGIASVPVGLDTRPQFQHRATYAGGDVQAVTQSPVRGVTAGKDPQSGVAATVATVNLSGWHPGDLTVYRRAAFGSTQTTPTVTAVFPGSRTTQTATVQEDDYGLQSEVALDAETIAGVAPAAKQRMYFTKNSSADYLLILQRMAADLLDADPSNDFQSASTSWGACEAGVLPSDLSAMRAAISQINAAGAAFFAASGDDGAYGCGDGTTASVDVPAVAEDAVAVGGVSMAGAAPSYTVTAWKGSGGGCSQVVASSSSRATPTASPCLKRAVPDIANLADPKTGYWVYDTVDGWAPVGGTSLAAPASAAGLAVALSAVGLAHPTAPSRLFPTVAYANPSAFTDVTVGDNGLYRAGTGFDLVTGLGVPHWDELAGLMAAAPTPVVTTHNEPVLFVNPTSTPAQTSLELVPGLNGFLPNGEPVDGYGAAAATGADSCTTTGSTAPQTVALGSGNGVHEVSLSVHTPDGCLRVDRPVFVDTAAPSAPPPAVTYTGTTKPSYRITWGSATDAAPSSGIAAYVLFVDDLTTGASVVDGFVTTGHSYPYSGSFAAVAGHAYGVELDVYDEAWNVGYRTATVRAPYDDRSFTVSTGWVRKSASADYLGSNLQSATAGKTAAVRFTGKTLTAGVIKSRYGGYVDVYVDGVKKLRYSLYASSTLYRQQVRLATFTTAGTHTVSLRVVGAHASGALGSYVFLDSFAIG